MKQHIISKDLLELSKEQFEAHKKAFYPPYFMLQQIDKKILEPNKDKAKKIEISDDGRLFVYLINSGDFYALPSIGQMIEYLLLKDGREGMDVWEIVKYSEYDLCDRLWKEVVKTYE